jgi:Mn-dependent DtxR family transcriptional regulator
MKMQKSAENYLETIYILSQEDSPVRSVDISVKLGFSKPSVSVAMKKLRLDGFIEIDSGGFITLTDLGQSVAESMYERHTHISALLVSLGVDKQTAIDDACKIEHIISEQSFIAIKNQVAKLKGDVGRN